MSRLLYKAINPPISWLLTSPFHKLMSHNTMLVEFRGRKSGRVMQTPISYSIDGDITLGFTGQQGIWWRNLQSDAAVRLCIAGEWHEKTAEVIVDEPSIIRPVLEKFLAAVPRDAAHANVRIEQGVANTSDLDLAASKLVLLRFLSP